MTYPSSTATRRASQGRLISVGDIDLNKEPTPEPVDAL